MISKEELHGQINGMRIDQALAWVKGQTGIDVHEAMSILEEFARAYYVHDDPAVLRAAARAQAFYVANGGEL